MIGAICRKLNEDSCIVIYLVDTYNQIDWFAEPSECVLGKEYSVYPYKETNEKRAGISVDKTINGEYVLRIPKGLAVPGPSDIPVLSWRGCPQWSDAG